MTNAYKYNVYSSNYCLLRSVDFAVIVCHQLAYSLVDDVLRALCMLVMDLVVNSHDQLNIFVNRVFLPSPTVRLCYVLTEEPIGTKLCRKLY